MANSQVDFSRDFPDRLDRSLFIIDPKTGLPRIGPDGKLIPNKLSPPKISPDLPMSQANGPQYASVSIPDIGPYGTATNRARPAQPYPNPMGGLFGPAFTPSVNPAIPTVAAPVSPDVKTDNPVRDAIVEQLIRRGSGQGGESGFNDAGLGYTPAAEPTSVPGVSVVNPQDQNEMDKALDEGRGVPVGQRDTPPESTPTQGQMTAAQLASLAGVMANNPAMDQSQFNSLDAQIGNPNAPQNQFSPNAPEGAPIGPNSSISMANVAPGVNGSFAPGHAPGEMSGAQAAAVGVTGFAGPPSVNANSSVNMGNVANSQFGSFAPGPANTPANTSFAPATAPQAPSAPEAPQAPGPIGETTQTGQLAGITQSQAIADAMQNDPGFNAQVANPTGYAIGKGINEAMPSNVYGQLDTVQAPMTAFSNVALENPGKNQPTKSDMTVQEALDAVFGTPSEPGWSFGKSSPENPDPDTGLTVGLSPPDTGMFGDVGITAAPGATLGPTSSPGQIAGFGDALAGAEAAQAAQGAPAGDAPADSPGIGFGPGQAAPAGYGPGEDAGATAAGEAAGMGVAGTAGDPGGPGPGDGVGGGGIGW